MGIRLAGTKVGMTQIFDEQGRVIPITGLRVEPCSIVRKKSDERDGYCALVLGYGEVKEKKLRKSERGLFHKAKISPTRFLKESRVSKEELDTYEIGQQIGVDYFKKGEYIDVSGKSKGRGFSGVMKRHGMAGAKRSHGTHEYFRHGGSIGASAFPSRVFKGKKMPGRYGGKRVTAQSLPIVDVKPDENLLFVKGAVPGPNKGYVILTHAVKKPHPVH